MVPVLRAEEAEFAGFPCAQVDVMEILDVTLILIVMMKIYGSNMDAIHTDVSSLPTDERGNGVLGFIASPAAD